ncbi:hypothetical protein EG328_009294 [Venturia inaequalis]|uniref:Uncharacterized protein n=1 Tax=Venturia inaequalis TaxID=5025 RepID=A0A8H3URX9_VENIN|nr:hypothetical protein EG328_009294 [Venturia inaequalis]KAE9974163.1 hypothetical protein EG327_008847 [Venturia inaequalis]
MASSRYTAISRDIASPQDMTSPRYTEISWDMASPRDTANSRYTASSRDMISPRDTIIPQKRQVHATQQIYERRQSRSDVLYSPHASNSMASTTEMKMNVMVPYHKFINQTYNHIDNHTFCDSPSTTPKKTFLSPLLNYFRAPSEETYHLDDSGLDEIREVVTSREAKRKGRSWDTKVVVGGVLVSGSNALVAEGTGTGDWRRPSLWG